MMRTNTNILAKAIEESYHVEHTSAQSDHRDFFLGSNGATKQSTPIVRSSHSTGGGKYYDEIETLQKSLSFPQVLFHMLEKIDKRRKDFSSIVSWHRTGMGFVIHEPDAFVRKVMPVFFRSQNKLTSFQRQLNNYGFKRTHESKRGMYMYYHRWFLRDDPALCQHIALKCKIIKTNDVIQKGDRQALLLKIFPGLRSSSWSRRNEMSNNINSFIPALTSADFSPAEGDQILDEAVAEICGCPAEDKPAQVGSHLQQSYVNSPLTIHHCAETSVILDEILWDVDVESLDTFEGL